MSSQMEASLRRVVYLYVHSCSLEDIWGSLAKFPAFFPCHEQGKGLLTCGWKPDVGRVSGSATGNTLCTLPFLAGHPRLSDSYNAFFYYNHSSWVYSQNFPPFLSATRRGRNAWRECSLVARDPLTACKQAEG